MPYTHTTFSEMKSLLASSMADVGKVWVVDTELGLALNDVMRMWQAASGWWRERAFFSLTPSTAFYDLPTNLPSQLGYTVTGATLLSMLKYRLAELPGATQQFTPDRGNADLLDALTQARNVFLEETGIVVGVQSTITVTAGAGLIDLVTELSTDKIIDVRRAQWITSGGKHYNVRRGSAKERSTYQRLPAPGRPYEFELVSPQYLQLIPTPDDNGQLSLLTVDSGAAIANDATVISIPNNLIWGLVWGAIDILLRSPGPAFDPQRAEGAANLFRMSIEIAKTYPVIIHAELDGVPVRPISLWTMDTSYEGWRGKSTGAPKDIAIAGQNMVAVRPVPDASPHSISFDLIRNADEYDDADDVQVGREFIDPILGCAEYLCTFKLGAERWNAAAPKLAAFIKAAGSFRSSQALYPFIEGAYLTSVKEAEDRPYRQSNNVNAEQVVVRRRKGR